MEEKIKKTQKKFTCNYVCKQNWEIFNGNKFRKITPANRNNPKRIELIEERKTNKNPVASSCGENGLDQI